jgi:ubiquinone/menaquinone biosynthesis C-methylase UbiE
MHYNFDTVAPIYDLVMPQRRPTEFLGLLNATTTDTILEVGAGTGRIARFYADQAESCVLLDPSTRMLERAQGKVPRARHVVGHVEAMEFADASFAKVISFDSLHHWRDQAQGLREVRRVLQPGGLFVVVEVDPSTFWGHKVTLFEKALRMKSRFHAPDDLAGMLASAGLRNITRRSVGEGITYALVCTR